MLNALFSPVRVCVSLEEDQVFVHPVDSTYPTNDPTLRGTVLLSLPSKRAISRFKVVLEGLCDVSPGDGHGYEQSTTIHKELVTEFNGEEFDAGTHHFNFAFIIPSSTATNQRSIYGRVRHYVKATVEFEGRLVPSASSSPTAFWITANPAPPGELPLPTDVSYQHFSKDLGPVGIHVVSPHFTVSALCSLKVSLLGAPQPGTITSVRGYINQTFTVELTDGTVVRPKTSNHLLVKVDKGANPCPTVPRDAHGLPLPPLAFCRDVLSTRMSASTPPLTPTSTQSSASSFGSGLPSTSPMTSYPSTSSSSSSISCGPSQSHADVPDKPVADPSPLVELPALTEYHYARICRVPNDDHVRPTTLEASEGRIRVSHRLSVEIRYKKPGSDEEYALSIAKPLEIASCCCLLDQMYLPAYSRAPPKTILKSGAMTCMCGWSLKEAFDRDGEALKRAGEIDPIPSGAHPRLLGVYGEEIDPASKSPAWSPLAHERGLPTPTEEHLLRLGSQ